MNDEENLPLRRRVPGAARAAPAQTAPPVLPESVLRRMQAVVDAARHDGEEAEPGPVTEPIPKITPSAKTQAGAESPPASRGRVVEFRRPAKRHRDESSGPAQRAGQPKRKHGDADPAAPSPQTQAQQQAPAAPQARDPQRAPAVPPRPQARETQQTTAAPRKPEAPTPSAQPAGAGPPPLPKRRPAESPPAATRSGGETAAAAPSASPKDAPPRVAWAPAGPSAAGTLPPALPAGALAATAAPPMRTVPTPAVDRAALSRTPPDLRKPHLAGTRVHSGRARRPIGIAAALVILLAAGGVAIALATRPAAPTADNHKLSPLERQELANTALAVTWIGHQASPGSVIACDPATCDALKAHGYPANELQVLKATSPYPRTAALVVETGRVRAIYGTSLRSDWAPQVLTTFGTGAAGVDIRVIAKNGASAYQRELAADLSARKLAGMALLRRSQIVASATARAQMASGAVDSRLLLAITALVTGHPIDIVDFGNDAAGASSGVPLRYGDLSERVPAAQMAPAAYVAAITAALGGLPAPYRPLRTHTIQLSGGVLVLQIDYAAPSPLGVFGPGGGG